MLFVKLKMKVIILAAGEGTRIRPLTDNIPKCLIPFGKTTILERQIEILKECGIKEEDIILVVGYHADKIKKINKKVKMILNEHYKNTNNAYSLYLGLREVRGDSILVMDGDIIFDKSVIEAILNSDNRTLITTKKADAVDEPGNRVRSEEGFVVEIGRDLDLKFPWDICDIMLKLDIKLLEDFKLEVSKECYKGSEWTCPVANFSKFNKVANLRLDRDKFRRVNINNYEEYLIAKKIFLNN